jgi:hypothetical protein
MFLYDSPQEYNLHYLSSEFIFKAFKASLTASAKLFLL